jgi:glutamate N-acetyltransferase/amino-acid N-acetyltransferase
MHPASMRPGDGREKRGTHRANLTLRHPLWGSWPMARRARTKHPIVSGFQFGAVRAGLKANPKAFDLGLIAADEEVSAAAVFTRNQVKGAPVELAADRMKSSRVRAILVNSGCANACTGPRGLRDARKTTTAVSKAMKSGRQVVLPASTGIIGEPLPTDLIVAAVPELVASLRPNNVANFSKAILTTDRGPKVAHRSVDVGGEQATILGVAKGAGMIHPNMATTLCFVLTDAKVLTSYLRKLLKRGVDASFNRISVDGETSTNDMAVALASDRFGADEIRGRGAVSERFSAAFQEVLDELAMMVVGDGDGAEHIVRIEVGGAPTMASAKALAERLATSQLVKASLYGRDPNWGRILAALGSTKVRFDPARVDIAFNRVTVVRRGKRVSGDAAAKAAEVMKERSYTLTVRLTEGEGEAYYTTCDLTQKQVKSSSVWRTS